MSKRIYVADDHKIWRDLMNDIFSKTSYDVKTFENGKKLTEAYDNEKPDLVISGINMPEMSGIKVAEYIRGEDTKTPIILMSTDDYDLSQYNVSFMNKGRFDLDNFRNLVNKLIGE